MIVRNPHLVRPLIGPPKDDPPLVVDPNGVKPRQVASEHFQTVARRYGEVAEPASLIDLDEFSQRHPRYGREAAVASSAEQFLCVPVCEGLDQSECVLFVIASLRRWEPNLWIGLNSCNRVPRIRSLDHPGTAPSTLPCKPQQENPP